MWIFHKEEPPLLALKLEGACGKEHSWLLKAESRSLPTVNKETLVLQPQGTWLGQQAEWAWERLWAPKDTACWRPCESLSRESRHSMSRLLTYGNCELNLH